MAYKKQLNHCLNLLKKNNAPQEMIQEIKDVLKYYNSNPNEYDIKREIINACVRFNFTKCFENEHNEKWFVRKKDVFSKTANEEICYRRGFIQGMSELGSLLNVPKEKLDKIIKPYFEWRLSSIFNLRETPGSISENSIINSILDYHKE